MVDYPQERYTRFSLINNIVCITYTCTLEYMYLLAICFSETIGLTVVKKDNVHKNHLYKMFYNMVQLQSCLSMQSIFLPSDPLVSEATLLHILIVNI